MKKDVCIIAEIAQAHDGSLGIAHSFIDALATTGVAAVKFQVHIADAESSSREKFRIKFSYCDRTRFDYWRRLEFTLKEWAGLKKHCEHAGLEFIASPFSMAAVALLEKIGLKRYKIASGEVENLLMLDQISRTGKDIILSSGMSSYSELDQTVDFIRARGNRLSLMQCTTAYPTPPEKIGLNVIPEMRSRYGLPIGLSDHSGKIFPSLAAVTLGAELIEVHAAFDRSMFGPDSSSSLTISELRQLVDGVDFIRRSLSRPVDKSDARAFAPLRKLFGKSLAVRRSLGTGHAIRSRDLETKKPAGQGLSSKEYLRAVGRRLIKNKIKNEFLSLRDLS